MTLLRGGWRKALDLHCYTPEEFRGEIADGIWKLALPLSSRSLLPLGGRRVSAAADGMREPRVPAPTGRDLL